MQQTIKEIKCQLNEKKYTKLYPSGPRPGLFYSTAKAHKLQTGQALRQ